MVVILLLIVIAALIAGLMFSGIGAKLWAKRTAPGESASGPDLVDQEDPARDRQEDPGRDSTMAPDERGVYHRESR